MTALGERRDIISDDLEAMRDELGLPVRWDPESGTYRLEVETPSGESRQEGCDLALLYRAIALEEYLYVTVTTESGIEKRIHALPGKVKKVRGRRQVKLRERERRLARGQPRGDHRGGRSLRHQQIGRRYSEP